MCRNILCGRTLGPLGPLQAEKESIATAIAAKQVASFELHLMTPSVPVLHGEAQPSNGEFVRNAGCDQGLSASD